jgi:hypothetical protein
VVVAFLTSRAGPSRATVSPPQSVNACRETRATVPPHTRRFAGPTPASTVETPWVRILLWQLLRAKRFVGFSDVTVLHALFARLAPGLITLHGPMPATPHFAHASEEHQHELRAALFGGASVHIVGAWPGL